MRAALAELRAGEDAVVAGLEASQWAAGEWAGGPPHESEI